MQSLCIRRHLRMIDKHRRHYVYDTVFQFIIDNNLKVFPISVQKLCSLLNTELVTLSDIVRHSNLRIKDVFDIWGNEDGCVMAYEHNGTLYHKIDPLSEYVLQFAKNVCTFCSDIQKTPRLMHSNNHIALLLMHNTTRKQE